MYTRYHCTATALLYYYCTTIVLLLFYCTSTVLATTKQLDPPKQISRGEETTPTARVGGLPHAVNTL